MPLPPRIQQLRDSGVLRVAGMLATAFLASMCGSSGCDGDAGGSGDGQRCTRSKESSSLVITLPERSHSHCVVEYGGAAEATETIKGFIFNAPDGSIVLDSCPPDADCETVKTKTILSIVAGDERPAIPLSIPDGTFVELTLQWKKPGGSWPMCKSRILIRNLPTWSDRPNPTSSGSFFWFAEHYSDNDPAYSWPDDPFLVEPEIACYPDRPGGEHSPYYAWRFSSPDSPGSEVVAYMGETATWSVPDGELAGEYEVRNIRGDEGSGHYDFVYWIVRK